MTRAPEPLPERVEVAIVGGGVAGLATAALLAENGARVALVEAGPVLGGGFSGRDAGMALTTLLEHPGRLVAALGPEQTREILRFLQENLDLLDQAGLLHRTGSLAVAAMPGEEADVEAGIEALTLLGIPAERWPAERLAAWGIRATGPARFVPGDGLVAPDLALAALADRARTAGATLLVNAKVDALDDRRLHVAGRALTAEIVVLTAGWSLARLLPWLADKLTPVRSQALVLAPPCPFPPHALLAQHGTVFARPMPDDGLLVGGCRWATPHMEVGETDDRIVVPAIDRHIRGFVARHLPHLADRPVTHRWSAIATHTCDGLPIVGPLPGRPRLIVCTGWNGQPWAYALRAARAVADGLLTGRALGVPKPLSPSRFV